MYGLPTQLYPVPQGMFDDQSSCFGTGIDRQIFYSIKDGNWSDMSVWETVSQNVGRLPTANDDVYISYGTTVTANITASVNNLFVAGTMKAIGSLTISISGNIKSVGLIDFTGSSISLYLYGVDNYIMNFIAGSSILYYQRNGDQFIMPIIYYGLYINNTGTKYSVKDLIVNGSFFINSNATADLTGSNLVVGGTSAVNYPMNFIKRDDGSLLFIGPLSTPNTVNINFIFLGNLDVEFRGGINGVAFGSNSNLGSGQYRFTTNNQSIKFYPTAVTSIFYCAILIDNIVLTNSSGSLLCVGGTINGSTPGSSFINNGIIAFYTANASDTAMNVGTSNITTGVNSTISYRMSGNYTLPFTTYSGLAIQVATGIKTVTGDLTVNGSLTIDSVCTLELGNYNLDAAGGSINGLLSKTGPGSILFRDSVFVSKWYNLPGNPTIEFRNGCTFTVPYQNTWTGLITFSTNNQTADLVVAGTMPDILISGAITLYTSTGHSRSAIFNQISGDNSLSTFCNRLYEAGGQDCQYKSAIQPMLTGILDCNSYMNRFRYNRNGDQDVKGTTYRIIEFGGSGVKTLQGNVVVNVSAGGSWSITGTATIDYNGFTITTI